MVRIIPDDANLETIMEQVRNNILELNIKNSKSISVFLVTKEKFERIWNTLFDDEFLLKTKEYWLDLIEREKVLVVEDNYTNFPIDTFEII